MWIRSASPRSSRDNGEGVRREWTEAEVASATAIALDICRLQLEKVSARRIRLSHRDARSEVPLRTAAAELRQLVQELDGSTTTTP